MNDVQASTFGDVLRRLRLQAGMTQEGLAERAGVSAKAVSELERDASRIPRLDTVARLAAALDLDASQRARLLTRARPVLGTSAPVPEERSHTPLPLHMTPLFGRTGATEAVAALVRGGEWPEGVRLITLTGPGGVGKTRLAIAVATDVADAFPDGVVFVDLAPLRDSRLVLATIAGRLGIDERDPRTLPERLMASLRRKHLLVLLDNIEHLPGAWKDVLALVEACPRLTILATSRIPLRVRGEREYRVAPLELPDGDAPDALAHSPAALLFLDRARASGPMLTLTTESAPAIAAICRRLDGLPLAIELAAGWTRLLPLPALLARLERRLPLLVGGPHDLPARQRTLRNTIAWSYELLTAPQQRLFRWLCVFAGGCTADAAVAVCGGDEPAVLLRIAELVDRSLLQVRPDGAEPHFVVLETLREFGLERLEASGEAESARRAHAAYCLALAEDAARGLLGPDAARWGARLDREHDNLRAALRWSLADHDAVTSVRLAGALWRFWFDRGHLSEGRDWLRAALDLPVGPEADDVHARARALIGAVRLAIEIGAYDEAAVRCAQAIDLARTRGLRSDLVAALNAAGLLDRSRGEYEASTRRHEEALALAQELADRSGMAAALTGLVYAFTFSGDPGRGRELARESLALLRDGGDRRALADALLGATASLHFSDDFGETEALATEALALYRDLGDTGRVADALWVLGITVQAQGRHHQAIALHEENLALRRARGDEHGTIQPLSALALIALNQGDHRHARVLLDETLVLLERYDDPWSRAMTLTLLGQVEIAADEPAAAAARCAAGAHLFQRIGNPLYLPWCLEGLAALAAGRCDWVLTARLCGACDALRTGATALPAVPARYACTVADCRAALGEDAFATAYDAGRALSPQQALAEAGVIDPDETSQIASHPPRSGQPGSGESARR